MQRQSLASPQALGRWLTTVHGGVAATSQTFIAGRVYLMQFVVPQSVMVDGLSYTVGAVSVGNVIGGIVGPVSRTADSPDGGVVLVQSASTAQAAINTAQLLTWTSVTLQPGVYYAALQGSDATGTYVRHSATLQAPGLITQYDRAGGYGALTSPNPATVSTAGPPGLRLRLT
jgi:hypothetical protein